MTAIFGTTVFFSVLLHKHDRRGNGYGREKAAIFVMGMLYGHLPLCAPSGAGGGNHAACGGKNHCAGCGTRRLDPGKTGKTGVDEQELNLAIVKKLQAYLEQGGARVYVTRGDGHGFGTEQTGGHAGAER